MNSIGIDTLAQPRPGRPVLMLGSVSLVGTKGVVQKMGLLHLKSSRKTGCFPKQLDKTVDELSRKSRSSGDLRHEQTLVLACSAASCVRVVESWMSLRRSGMSAISATPATKLPQPSRENNFE